MGGPVSTWVLAFADCSNAIDLTSSLGVLVAGLLRGGRRAGFDSQHYRG